MLTISSPIWHATFNTSLSPLDWYRAAEPHGVFHTWLSNPRYSRKMSNISLNASIVAVSGHVVQRRHQRDHKAGVPVRVAFDAFLDHEDRSLTPRHVIEPGVVPERSFGVCVPHRQVSACQLGLRVVQPTNEIAGADRLADVSGGQQAQRTVGRGGRVDDSVVADPERESATFELGVQEPVRKSVGDLEPLPRHCPRIRYGYG